MEGLGSFQCEGSCFFFLLSQGFWDSGAVWGLGYIVGCLGRVHLNDVKHEKSKRV